MLVNAMPTSKDDKSVSVSEGIEAVRYRVNSGISSSYVIDRQ